MGDSFEDYAKLPVFKGPNMLPEANMSYIVYRMRPHLSYCRVFFLKKMHEWCKYIKEMDARRALKQMSGCSANGSETFNSTLLEPPPKLCYDDFFCSTDITDYWIYSLSILSSIFVLFGILSVIVFFGTIISKKFYSLISKPSFIAYTVPILFFQLVYQVLGLYVYVTSGLQKTVDNQTEVYINYCSMSIPYALPLMDLSFQLVSWYMAMQIVDNYWSLTHPSFSRDLKIIHYIRNVILIFICFSLYTVPKFFKFMLRLDEDTNQNQVVLGLGSIPQFKYLLGWFKMTFEILIPLILLAVFLSLFRKHDASSKTKTYSDSSETETEQFRWAFNRAGTVLAVCLGMKIGFFLLNGIFDGIKWMNFFLKNVEFAYQSFSLAVWPLYILISSRRLIYQKVDHK